MEDRLSDEIQKVITRAGECVRAKVHNESQLPESKAHGLLVHPNAFVLLLAAIKCAAHAHKFCALQTQNFCGRFCVSWANLCVLRDRRLRDEGLALAFAGVGRWHSGPKSSNSFFERPISWALHTNAHSMIACGACKIFVV